MNKKSVNRIVSLVLTFVMVLSLLPSGILRTDAASVITGGQTVDGHTLDQWKLYFGAQESNANQVALSTEFAGSVWTDKSVFDPADIPAQLTNAKYNGNSFTIADEGDNFLVALSAIASNKQVVGYSTIPTDTVVILDLSSSMRSTDDNGGSAVDELVEATNKAITDLLALNRNNRIAVVIYAGNVNKAFDSGNGLTQVVLPLDSYTTQTPGTYLESVSVGRNQDYAIEVVDGVRNSAGSSVSASRFETATGTFMQDGIYEAMRVFLGAEPVVQEGVQKGTTRLPIMVLMTDGEPTLANPDYNGNDGRTDLGSSSMYDYNGSTGNVSIAGNGNTSYSHRDTIAFVTSLTAAFAKKSIEAHYGTDGLMYTLPYGNAVLSRPEALSVLNPVQASNVQNALWNHFLDGREVPVYRYRSDSGSWGGNSNYNYYYASNSDKASEKLTAADRLYVDKYFPAANDEGMLRAFEDIVAEIIIQSKYYPTYVENDHDHDGYLTFADKIGSYMEVTDVKGIVLGNRLFSGAAMAKGFNEENLGTVDRPTALGDAFVNSVKTRLGITSTAQARALIANAFEHGQLSYTSDTRFSHYIGWFSDAEGNFVDFWHEDLTDAQIAEVAATKNATHVVRSYGFLGDTGDMPGVNDTDMMYMTVRVATDIATMNTIATWRVPASLVPTITYEVEVEVNSDGDIIRLTDLALAADSATTPIRLLYEVGLRKDITDWNLAEKVDAAYVQENGYTFYSNKWAQEPDDVTVNTYSHFEPSVQNERYYYTQDTEVLVKNGESYVPYTGGQPSGSGYWHSLQVYEKLENGSLRIHTHYEPISAGAMESVRQEGQGWVIPKDTVHRYYDYEVTEKLGNRTETMRYSDHPFVVKNGDIYYTYSTLGNNGKFTTAPATGIRLTKSLAAGYETDNSFTFVIAGDIANAQVARLNSDGTEASREALPASGQVVLAAGETVYIVGLTPGSYTVTEQIAVGADYHVQSVLVNGQSVGTAAQLTLAEQTITPVEFINAEQGYGALVVSKDVNYPADFAPTAAHEAKTFTVDVTFTGDIASMAPPAEAQVNGNTYTLTLRDGESATFLGIKHGVTYTVTERDLPTGYSLTEVRYSNEDKAIRSAVTDEAHVVNAYSLTPATVPLKVVGTKTVTGGWPANAAFTLRLLEIVDFASGNTIDTGLTATVTEANAGYEIDMSGLTFHKEGTYNFRVVEDIPADRIPDMAYDRSSGLFSVTVTDTDADGKLEIARVDSYQNTQLTGDANGYVITKDFNNVVTRDIVYLNVQKTVRDGSGKTYTDHLADITFGLFESTTAAAPSYYVQTDGSGKAGFAVPVSQVSLGEGKTFYLREIAPAVENRVVGMEYDESWVAAIRISWDSINNVAVTEYAPVGTPADDSWTLHTEGQTIFTHTNTYEPNVYSTPEILLSGVKTLNGSNDLGDRVFSFGLYKTTAAFVIQGQALQTVQNRGNAIAFDGVAFTTPGLHYLTVKEEATDLGGVTVDGRQYHITVLVEKYAAADGITRLRVAEGYPHIALYGQSGAVAADALNFNNRYGVTGTTSVVLDGTKTLTGRPLLNSEFRFRLEEVADAQGTALAGGVVLEAENGAATDGAAAIRFAPIVYSKVGVHYYKLTEVAGPAGNGVTYSSDSFIYKVEVKDNGQGGLSAEKSVVGDRSVVFANSYKARGGSTGVFAVKELSGKVLGDEQFSFHLLQTQQDFITPVSGGVNKTVKNNGQGGIDFGTLTYGQEGTFYYVIREVIPETAEPGIVYDTTAYRITVRVVDDQKGQLQVFASTEMVADEDGQTVITPVSSVVFYNRYVVAGDAKVILQGAKYLNGRALADGEFTFELYETDETYSTQGVTPITTNNISGLFDFELSFGAEDVDTMHYYVVREKNAGQTIEGVTYSQRSYNIAVAVKDNGAGGVEAQITAEGLTVTESEGVYKVSGIAFTNEYDCDTEELVLTVKKTMTGDKTDPAGFTFGLYTDLTKEPVAKVTSDADGVVSFEKLNFSLLDVQDEAYVFYIREILPVVDGKTVAVKDNVTYDEKVYTVSLTVSHDGKGDLSVSYSVDGEAADEATYQFAFTNSYKKPAANNPQTGDETPIALFVTMLLLSGSAIMAMVILPKKRASV